ncbi:coiled-coil domain-containing protein 92 [Striga asiatica]|uniref:Coiled-coil domain-containing protein 92 n=1 Tax=Striga asiatica TaxID=4170 RepID=A0A5A7NXG4_STRAF|nr:coiled-coil domain-containing protein 92 [Striga asiatica]
MGVGIVVLLPNAARDSELEFVSVSTGEKEGHIALYDEAVVTVPDLAVGVANASWGPFPCELPPVASDFEAVAVVSSLRLVSHKTEKGHVNGCHSQLKGLKVEAEILSETMEYLIKLT